MDGQYVSIRYIDTERELHTRYNDEITDKYK